MSALVAGVVVLGLQPGCASIWRVRGVEKGLAAVSTQVEELRKLNEASNRVLAGTSAELKDLQSGAAELARAERETTQQLSRIEARLADAEGTIRELRASVADLSREVGRLVARPSGPELAPREPLARPGPPEQLYAAALANMRAGEHGQAVLDFLDFIAKYPKHQLAASAQYWIGETYYLQRDFRQALAEFQKVIGQYGKSDKAADALLKIGLCYKALHEPRRAREAWEKLIEEFPGSEAARKARALRQARPTSSPRSR